MFESSFLEMLVVGVVALLVIGPERLPTVARAIGRWIGKVRRFVAKTRADIDRELNTEELRNMLYKQEEEIRNMQAMMREKTDSVRKELEQHDKPD
ncbi:Sec-independent protein translocase protein TatB [Thiothrix lacustris]|uniref:Sec-independent protein translocase protein TatB n=1 Tax=Thiothrix lacustris TaxID=525917 RepID=A0ABY9MUF3_9GAMM|nr:Sec-independent protein translocase protein TatB [Thiothrix lacustris]WML92143.1 Sec-independent protein translocase protein TatB [Thiothrix lacustris]